MFDESAFLRLISGERTGVAASLLCAGLRVGSWGYRVATSLRNKAFDCGLKKTHSATVPVISVGNLTTGGTGKTPVVAWVVNQLQTLGHSPVILSRGYRSLDGEENDEKLVLDQLCPGIPHVQNPDRVSGAKTACEEFGADIIVLDDGFQHRRLHRDLNLVLIDATRPWGYGTVLPRGLLRESRSGLKRADAILITRADQIDERARQQLLEEIRAHVPDLLLSGVWSEICSEICFPPVQLRNIAGEIAPLEKFAAQRTGMFCGIGNPAGFQATLEELQTNITVKKLYPDHYHYTAEDLTDLETLANNEHLTAWITTQKDLVKIPHKSLGNAELWAMEIGVRFLESSPNKEAQWQQALQELFDGS